MANVAALPGMNRQMSRRVMPDVMYIPAMDFGLEM
jgi:hypothetical protein